MARSNPGSLDPNSFDWAPSPGTDPGHQHDSSSLINVLGRSLGLVGATAATRYVGATASGAPVSGTFLTGDFVVDQSGAVIVCTTGGSPGTWSTVGAVKSFNGRTGVIKLTSGDFVQGSGITISVDGSGVVTISASGGGGGGVLFDYGDGSDGAVTLDGSTTFAAFASLSGSTYTLTRDLFATTLTINNGITLVSANYRIRCTVGIVFVGTTGNINCDGGAANVTVGGAAIASGVFFGGTAGANGATTANGVGGGVSSPSLGGAGGNSGGGSGGTAGNGGAATGPVGASIQQHSLFFAQNGFGFSQSVVSFKGGASGGRGGGDGTAGGGAGAGGGTVFISCPSITGTGTISARGGLGGTPAGGDRGAGGGGGGGWIVTACPSVAGTVTVTVAGGLPGTPTGAGNTGTQGASGTIFALTSWT